MSARATLAESFASKKYHGTTNAVRVSMLGEEHTRFELIPGVAFAFTNTVK